MYLTDKINCLTESLGQNEKLKDIRFIKAFPYVKRPTELTKVTAVLSPYEMECESISIDNLDYCAQGSIAIDLFSPFRFGSPCATDCMQRILADIITPAVSAVSISSVTKDEDTDCYKVRAVITYSLVYRGDEE